MPLLHPNYLKFEKPKNELYLTLSALVDRKFYAKVTGIQDKVNSFIEGQDTLKKIARETDWDKLFNTFKFSGRLIYKYPKDRLHISILSLATYNIIDLREFDTARRAIEGTPNFKKLKRLIFNLQDYFERDVLSNKKEIEAKIKKIFLPAGLEGSISLSVFPSSSEFSCNLNRFKEDTLTLLNKKLLENEFKIKAYPEKHPQYFALNIFRFIDNNEYLINIGKKFYSQLKFLSEEIKKSPIDIRLIPNITISDPYLSNKSPFLNPRHH